jgi:cytochrome P450
VVDVQPRPLGVPNPNEVDLARTGNRHHSFGLGIHRCIGSNVARMVFKRMVTAVLDRMPDYGSWSTRRGWRSRSPSATAGPLMRKLSEHGIQPQQIE